MSQATLEVNGEIRRYEGGEMPETVAHLVREMNLTPEMVVAEVNGEIVGRKDFASRKLVSGDAVELVRFVGGG